MTSPGEGNKKEADNTTPSQSETNMGETYVKRRYLERLKL